jgi:hypothetical protein
MLPELINKEEIEHQNTIGINSIHPTADIHPDAIVSLFSFY